MKHEAVPLLEETVLRGFRLDATTFSVLLLRHLLCSARLGNSYGGKPFEESEGRDVFASS